MSTYSDRLQPALQNLLQCVVRFFHPRSSCTSHVGGRFRRTKITRKDRDVAENLQLYSGCSVLPPEIVMHDDAYIGGRSENNTECVVTTISGGRTKQLDIFCNVTGFTSYFLSFIVVELIWFFHGAIQLYLST